jgi:cbb3-type cytochrome c oxidase subunit III
MARQLKEDLVMSAGKFLPLILLLVTIYATTSGCSNNEEIETVENPYAGYLSYRQYCASCHGLEANGKGPVASTLKSPPADLTKLSKKYGMPLPRKKLIDFIDGRRMVRSHGTREMPVWGDKLFEVAPSREFRNAAILEVIESIVIYLETIQEENEN